MRKKVIKKNYGLVVMCDKWYCGICENLVAPPQIDVYLCIKCRQ